MMLKKIAPFVLVIIAGVIAVVVYNSNHSTSPLEKTKEKEVHLHAGFQVYVDGKLQDFSDIKYMHIEPCSTDSHKEENEDEQIEKAHLHDNVGNVVHVHREASMWNDLFTNINYPISKDFVGYVNGERVDDILNQPITQYESVVFFEGNTDNVEKKLETRVTKEHIQTVEKQGESCGSS